MKQAERRLDRRSAPEGCGSARARAGRPTRSRPKRRRRWRWRRAGGGGIDGDDGLGHCPEDHAKLLPVLLQPVKTALDFGHGSIEDPDQAARRSPDVDQDLPGAPARAKLFQAATYLAQGVVPAQTTRPRAASPAIASVIQSQVITRSALPFAVPIVYLDQYPGWGEQGQRLVLDRQVVDVKERFADDL